jgi:hypothetical protein
VAEDGNVIGSGIRGGTARKRTGGGMGEVGWGRGGMDAGERGGVSVEEAEDEVSWQGK